MSTVDPATKTRFWDSFSASTEDIREGLSVGQATFANGHWTKRAYFCARVALHPLIVAYKDPVPILNAFARDYQTENIAPNSHAVQSRTVEDAVWSIGQAIAMLGAKDPRMTPTCNLDGRLHGIRNCSGAYATAAGRNCSSLVVPGEGVEDGDRVLISDE